MDLFEYKTLIKKILVDSEKYENLHDVYQVLLNMKQEFDFFTDADARKYAMNVSIYCHEMCAFIAEHLDSKEAKYKYETLY